MRVLLVVPPFAASGWPSLGVHVLQAVGCAEGAEVRVRYANLAFARRVGPSVYEALCARPVDRLDGERLFGRSAWGLTPELSDGELADEAERFVEALADELIAEGPDVVGCTTSFEQTNASVALLRAIKGRAPSVRTVIGGANCEGRMGEALARAAPFVDHVFSGESEEGFARLCRGEALPRVVSGRPCLDLDRLPTPDLTDWLGAVRACLPDRDPATLWLAWEASRGCWWGQKHHCAFCGLNGEGMGFRAKAADKVLGELRGLEGLGVRKVLFTDNILPHAYHRTLLPALAGQGLDLELFFEVKANLDLAQVRGLRAAGVTVIQPGIESLSTDQLRRMRKGVSARQNVALLRYARSVGLEVRWNLLTGLPGDTDADLRCVVELAPKLRHLQPPRGLVPLSIDRFSPYFDEPEAYGITELRPLPAYREVYPDPELAYHFEGRVPCETTVEVRRAAEEAVTAWGAAWEEAPPLLEVRRAGDGLLLVDTRGAPRSEWLTPGQAHAALVGGPVERVRLAGWAFRREVAAALDGWCVPLATAAPALLGEIEASGPPSDDLVRLGTLSAG